MKIQSKHIFFALVPIAVVIAASAYLGGFRPGVESVPPKAKHAPPLTQPAETSPAPASLKTASVSESPSNVSNADSSSGSDLLNLSLVGTGLKDAHTPFSVLRANDTMLQKLCYEGDAFGNVVIEKIWPDKVRVRQGDRRRLLYKSAAGLSMDSENTMPEPDLPIDHPIGRDSRFYADVQAVKKLMRQISLRQNTEDNDAAQGVVVSATAPDSVFDRAGLAAGDVITAVDWKEINNMDDAMEIYESVRSSSKGTFQIIRNGKAHTLHYENILEFEKE